MPMLDVIRPRQLRHFLRRRWRWLLRLSAFSTIISHGIRIVSSPRQLQHLLDAAFEFDGSNSIIDEVYLGFLPTPYHNHMRTKRSGRDPSSSSSSSPASDDLLHISFQLHDPKTYPYTTELHTQNKCPLGEVIAVIDNGTAYPTGVFRSGELPPSLVRVEGDTQISEQAIAESHKNENDTVNNISHVGRGTGRVLDFTATISTNLKILFIGDSVMVQLAQAFDKMVMGGNNREYYDNDNLNQNHEHNADNSTRNFLWKHWRTIEDGGTVVAPTRGGGASATWRMTGLLSRSKNMTGLLTLTKTGEPVILERPLVYPWKHFTEEQIGLVNALKRPIVGAWKQEQVDKLLGHTYSSGGKQEHNQQQSHTENATKTTTIGKFDVCIIRVMHGWMPFQDITHDRLVEAIELSFKLLGATTVVLMTVPFTNNVKNKEDVKKMNEVNKDIRQIARDWHSLQENNNATSSSGVQHVLVLEYGTYYNHIIWSSGIHLGYKGLTHPLKATPQSFNTESTFIQDRLKTRFFSPSIPMVCSDRASLEPWKGSNCNRNYLFIDGQHMCPETLAGRYAAGVACLLGCVYNGRRIGDATNSDGSTNSSSNQGYSRERLERKIRACERECNDQFLSVVPIDESWIDTNTTLASFSCGKANEFE